MSQSNVSKPEDRSRFSSLLARSMGRDATSATAITTESSAIVQLDWGQSEEGPLLLISSGTRSVVFKLGARPDAAVQVQALPPLSHSRG